MTAEPELLWAQDCFLHGHLLASWITDYIDLEESLAVGSIAQEEIAHAALLFELAGFDAADRDAVVYEWDAGSWQPARLACVVTDHWPTAVVRGLLLAAASLARGAWLGASADPVRRDAASVLTAERQLHVTHWTRWVRRLGGDPRTAGELGAAVHALLPMSADLFDGIGGNDVTGQELRGQWAAHVAAVLGDGGVPSDPLSYTATVRSSGTGLPDARKVLATVRALRTVPEDGVLGIYR